MLALELPQVGFGPLGLKIKVGEPKDFNPLSHTIFAFGWGMGWGSSFARPATKLKVTARMIFASVKYFHLQTRMNWLSSLAIILDNGFLLTLSCLLI